MAAKPVSLLTAKELRTWRNGLVKRGLKPSSANRITKNLKAALNLAAKDDPRISTKAWDDLERLEERDVARNVILNDDTVKAIVLGCYQFEHRFGVLIETLAETGARESQVLRCEVADLQDDPAAPRLMMPSSRKGGGDRKIERKPLPISPRLAAMLRQASAGRAAERAAARQAIANPRFLPRRHRAARPGRRGDALCAAAFIDCRMLLAAVPVRVVAAHHDTTVAEIEKHYRRYIIGDQTDTMVRRSLLDVAAPASAADKVVALVGR